MQCKVCEDKIEDTQYDDILYGCCSYDCSNRFLLIKELAHSYKELPINDRWMFLSEIGGYGVSDNTCYVHPNDE